MTKKKIHRGEVIRAAITKWCEKHDKSLEEAGEVIGYSRGHLYVLFDNPDVELKPIIKISRGIRYDFSKDFPDLAEDLSDMTLDNTLSEPEPKYGNKPDPELEKCIQEKNLWKEKYYELLEKQNELLEQRAGNSGGK